MSSTLIGLLVGNTGADTLSGTASEANYDGF